MATATCVVRNAACYCHAGTRRCTAMMVSPRPMLRVVVGGLHCASSTPECALADLCTGGEVEDDNENENDDENDDTSDEDDDDEDEDEDEDDRRRLAVSVSRARAAAVRNARIAAATVRAAHAQRWGLARALSGHLDEDEDEVRTCLHSFWHIADGQPA